MVDTLYRKKHGVIQQLSRADTSQLNFMEFLEKPVSVAGALLVSSDFMCRLISPTLKFNISTSNIGKLKCTILLKY